MLRIVVVGCGRLGSELALSASESGHQVTVVDLNASAFNRLPEMFKGRLQQGDALNRSVLVRSGIEQADVVFPVTKDDRVNAVIGHIARSAFGVPIVTVRNHDPRRLPIIEAFGLDVVSTSTWGVDQFMRGLAGTMKRRA